jgi:predicted DNA repair protein MutK
MHRLCTGAPWAAKTLELLRQWLHSSLSEVSMASSLFALLDDIATVLDDVALLTKVAAKKSAGVLGDDLALNAQQVAGVKAERELPVVWAVAKGSMLNKAILVPAALAISAFAPWAVTPLLMIGGAFLCYEGFEKLAHKFLHSKAEDAAREKQLLEALADPTVDLVALEKDKIKGAVRTDFILSAEIIAITLGTVQDSAFMTQLAVLSGIAILMTVGVYGLVAGIVKLDDGGLYLSKKTGVLRSLGLAILATAPWLMKGLSVAGTAAMFLVGGGILTHGFPALHHAIEALAARAGSVLGAITPLLADAVVGIAAGALVLAAVTLVKKLLPRRA